MEFDDQVLFGTQQLTAKLVYIITVALYIAPKYSCLVKYNIHVNFTLEQNCRLFCLTTR